MALYMHEHENKNHKKSRKEGLTLLQKKHVINNYNFV